MPSSSFDLDPFTVLVIQLFAPFDVHAKFHAFLWELKSSPHPFLILTPSWLLVLLVCLVSTTRHSSHPSLNIWNLNAVRKKLQGKVTGYVIVTLRESLRVIGGGSTEAGSR